MKLSEMSTVDGFQMTARLVPHVDAIMADQNVRKVMTDGKNRSVFSAYMAMLGAAAGARMDDTVEILAALTGKSADEIKAQPFKDTLADAKAVWDDDLKQLFF